MPTRDTRPSGLEVRTGNRVDTRAAKNAGPGLVGYGAVFDTVTTIGMFFQFDEEVAPGAWAKTIDEGDIRSMFNHDENWLLGRTSAGTLTLSEDDTGLRYDIDINQDDPQAMAVHARVARGDVTGSSVWFRVIREEWTEPTDGNGLERPKRRIVEAELFETGPVVFPAFETTEVGVRSLDVLDATLRSAGVRSDHDRARLTADLLADPTQAEAELRSLFAHAPELRDAVCSCAHQTVPPAGDDGRAAPDRAPGRDGTPPSPGHLPPDIHHRKQQRQLEALLGGHQL